PSTRQRLTVTQLANQVLVGTYMPQKRPATNAQFVRQLKRDRRPLEFRLQHAIGLLDQLHREPTASVVGLITHFLAELRYRAKHEGITGRGELTPAVDLER